jgi:hypothetical protein
MKKLLIASTVFALTFMTIPAFAQSVKEAVVALKKLEARCQSGISYTDYGPAVGDAKVPVNLLLESEHAKRSPELTDSINRVMNHYEFAGKIWQLRFSPFFQGYGLIEVNSSLGQEIGTLYPKANAKNEKYFVEEIVPLVWEAASKELENTATLYTKTEGDMPSEIEKLNKENGKLKADTAQPEKQLETEK